MKQRIQMHLNRAFSVSGSGVKIPDLKDSDLKEPDAKDSPSKDRVVLRLAQAPYDFAFVAYFCKTTSDRELLIKVMSDPSYFQDFEMTSNGYVNFSVSGAIKYELLSKWQLERETYPYKRLKHLRELLLSEGIEPSTDFSTEHMATLASQLASAATIEAVDRLLEVALRQQSFRLLSRQELSDWLNLMMQLTI